MAEITQHAGTEVPAEGHGAKGGFPPFESETFASQILWLALTFGLLYILMSKLALPRVASILDQRRNRIASDLDTARQMKADSDAAAAAHEKALVEARTKAQAIASETHDKVKADAETARKAVEAELAAKLAAAEQSIHTTKTKAMGNVRSIAVETASAIVEQLTGQSPSSNDVAAAVELAVAGGRNA